MPKRSSQKQLFDLDPPPPSAAEGPAAPATPPATSEEAIVTAVSRVATPPPGSLEGKKIYVVDANSLIHQVFHALPPMSSPQGEPVGAVFGFSRDLFYLLEEKRPDYLFCAFDLPGKTFRHAMYEPYKEQRPAMDVDLASQLPLIRQVIEAMGVPALGLESFEADDILATLAQICGERGGHCFLVTGDKDCRQLIADRVVVYNIRKDQAIDREALWADWGVAPEQVVDFQALVGDSVDNVPGVPLIGPKFARQLLQQYGTLDSVLEHAKEVSGAKRKQSLLENRPKALLSRDLVRLNRHVPVPIDWDAGRVGRIDRRRLEDLFRRFGFRTLVDRVDALASRFGQPAAPTPPPRAEVRCHLVDTPEKLASLVEQLQRQTILSVDLETTNLWPRWAKIVGLAVTWKEDEAWYVPLRGPAGDCCLDPQPALDALRPVLENAAIEKIGQNLKYDMIVLRASNWPG
jgi:DNA polymerase-1